MAAEDVAVEQGEGGPSAGGSALPQGATGELNALLPEDPGQGEMLATPTAEVDPAELAELDPAESGDYEPAYVPEDEDDEFFVSETTRPDETISEGVTGMPVADMGESLRRALPSLVAAANAPGASEHMRTIVRWAVREANK